MISSIQYNLPIYFTDPLAIKSLIIEVIWTKLEKICLRNTVGGLKCNYINILFTKWVQYLSKYVSSIQFGVSGHFDSWDIFCAWGY